MYRSGLIQLVRRCHEWHFPPPASPLFEGYKLADSCSGIEMHSGNLGQALGHPALMTTWTPITMFWTFVLWCLDASLPVFE